MYKPNYTITNRILNQLTEIESMRLLASQARLLPDRAIELHFRATVEKVHSSTSIEGNPLTLKQVESVLRGKSLTRREYAEIEVRNYKKALDYIEKRKHEGMPVTIDDIFLLHRFAMKDLKPVEKTGELRKGPIYVANQDDEVKYTGPNPKALRKKLDEFLVWLNDTGKETHPCIRASVLHYQFAALHPFADGNGRTARLLTMLFLGLNKYDFAGAIVLDTYYAQHTAEYYSVFQNCHGKRYIEGHDITSWIEYFITGFLSSAKVLQAEIAILSLLEPLVEQKRLGRDDADVLLYAMQFGSISLSEAEEALPHLSRRTLQRKLKDLADNGYLVRKGAAKSTRYHFSK